MTADKRADRPPLTLAELDIATSRAALQLHVITGRLRERFLAFGAYDEATANDFEDLGRLAATLEGMARAEDRPPKSLIRGWLP